MIYDVYEWYINDIYTISESYPKNYQLIDKLVLYKE